jgi:hypothetical protein
MYILIANLKTKNSAPNDSKHCPDFEIGGACSTYRGRGEVYTGSGWGNLRERDHLD